MRMGSLDGRAVVAPVALFALTAAVAAILLSPGLTMGPTLDAAVFAVAADRIRDGARLYVDVWDHKPPGMFLVNVVLQSVWPGPDGWTPVWLGSVGSIATAATVLGLAFRRLPGGPGLVAMLAAVAMAVHPLALGGGQTETVAMVPASLALLIASRARARPGWAAGSGLLVGIAAVVSFQAAVVAVPCALLAWDLRGGRRLLRVTALVGVGLVLPAIASALWLAWSGLLPAAIDAIVDYNRAYLVLNRAHPDHSEWAVRWSVPVLAFLLIPAALGLLAVVVGRRWSATSIASIAWLGAGFGTLMVQSRLEPHYLVVLAVPPLVVLASHVLPLVAAPAGFVLRLLASLSIAIGVVVSALYLSGWDQLIAQGALSDRPSEERVAAWVESASQPADTILVWGNAPQIYLWSAREPASRYIYFYPLMTPGYSSTAQARSFLLEIQRSSPKVIVDGGRGAVLLLEPAEFDRGDGRDFDALDRVRRWVRDRYVDGGTVGDLRVYVRRDG